MRNFIEKILALSICLMMLAGFSVASAEGSTDWVRGVVTARGEGFPPDRAKAKGHRRIMARQAALLDAYRRLAESVEGIHVTAQSRISDLQTEFDIVDSDVDAVVKGAKIVSERYNDDETFEVILELPLYGSSNSVAQKMIFKPHAKEAFPAPIATAKTQGNYTGLIIDCRGRNIQGCMLPIVFSEDSREIYRYENTDYDEALANGIVSYANDKKSATQAGANPLVINASGVKDGNPLVTNQDADLILSENQTSHFLDNCAVVIIL